MSVQLEGVANLLSRISNLGLSIDTHVKEKALKKGAGFLQEKIKEATPVKTGKLRDSITFSEVKNGKVEIGPDYAGAFYGHFVEFGSSKAGAQPFIQPTFENNKDEIEKIMSKEIKRSLNL
jgi:HK97 gp10 family phage protein